MTGADLRAARLALGWSQDEAARALGVASRARISHWETGARPVPDYVAAHVRTLLRWRAGEPHPSIKPGDEEPTK